MTASAVTRAGVPLRYRDGELMVQAKPSEVPPGKLEALRRHKAELAPIVEAFGAVEVLIRPRTEPPELVRERMFRIAKARRRAGEGR